MNLQEQFEILKQRWESETGGHSSQKIIINNRYYQEIISLGPKLIPILLKEMRERPNFWHAALHKLTGAQPVPQEHYGRLEFIAQYWVKWGEENGFKF